MSDYIDSHEGIQRRRLFSEAYALKPMNFNVTGLLEIERFCGRLSTADVVLDVGTSSMVDQVRAARGVGTRARMLGLDPVREAYDRYMPDCEKPPYPFVQAYAEEIPLANSSVAATTMYNTLFRTHDYKKALDEMKRVTVPGGIITISTNGVAHALNRHNDTNRVLWTLKERTGYKTAIQPLPAARFFSEQLPAIIEARKGLRIEKAIPHESWTKITHERIPDWLQTVKDDIAAIDMDGELRRQAMDIADEIIPELCERRMQHRALFDDNERPERERDGLNRLQKPSEPRFFDPIARLLLIIRNEKRA